MIFNAIGIPGCSIAAAGFLRMNRGNFIAIERTGLLCILECNLRFLQTLESLFFEPLLESDQFFLCCRCKIVEPFRLHDY